jgi:hypothetical protein
MSESREKPAVFMASDTKTCTECKTEIFHGAMFLPDKQSERLLCVECADLDELEFLPTGDAALTRRATKHSAVAYVVLRFSRARKRFERQGILVQPQALGLAEQECAADENVRLARQERNRERASRLDEQFVSSFAAAIRQHFPSIPAGRERQIAEHACLKFSGRVGRSAAAKAFDAEAIRLAVVAHIRHRETNYDHLLCKYVDRQEARWAVREKVDEVMEKWQRPPA